MNILVISAAPETDIDYIKKIYEEEDIAKVICADGGIYKAKELNIPVDIHIGDFDSSESISQGEKIVFPAEKDWSDTEAALKKAIDVGGDKIFITGAIGGRMDHSLSNMYALLNPEFNDLDLYLCDNKNIITALRCGKIELYEGFKYLGVVPADEKIEGVTIKGVKYPTENVDFYRHRSLGISNEIIDKENVNITFKGGKGFLIFSKDN